MDALPPTVAAAIAPPVPVTSAWIMAAVSLAALAWCVWWFVDALRRERAAVKAILADDDGHWRDDAIIGRLADRTDVVVPMRRPDAQAQRLTQEGRL